MKKIFKINILKDFLVKNQEIEDKKVIKKQIKVNKELMYPVTDLVNAIDTPFIVLNKQSKIIFINNAAKTNFNLSIDKNIYHTFRIPEFRQNIFDFISKRKKQKQFILNFFETSNL